MYVAGYRRYVEGFRAYSGKKDLTALKNFMVLYAFLAIILLMFASSFFNPKQMEYLTIPAFVLMGFELKSSFLMLIGILLDYPYLLLPFQFSCVSEFCSCS